MTFIEGDATLAAVSVHDEAVASVESLDSERAQVAGDPRTRDGSLGLHAADDDIPPMEPRIGT